MRLTAQFISTFSTQQDVQHANQYSSAQM